LTASGGRSKRSDWNSKLSTAKGTFFRTYVNKLLDLQKGLPSCGFLTVQGDRYVLHTANLRDFVRSVLQSGSLTHRDGQLVSKILSKRSQLPRFHAVALGSCVNVLECRLQWKAAVNYEEAINKSVEEVTSAIGEAQATSVPKVGPRREKRCALHSVFGMKQA
jgi:hypothetical protein